MHAVRWTILCLLSTVLADLIVLAIIARRSGIGIVIVILLVGVLSGLLVLRSPWLRIGWGRAKRPGPPSPAATLVRLGAGALLLCPGVLTDVLAVCLLLPPTRRWLTRAVGARGGDSLSSSEEMGYGDTPAGGPVPDRPEPVVRDAEFTMLREDRFPEDPG